MKRDKAYFSPNARIVRALDGILPVGHYIYTGDSRDFAVFEITNRLKAFYSSGTNRAIEAHVFLDVITEYDPSGANSIIDRIDTALTLEGVEVTSIASRGRDDETLLWHTELTCLVREAVNVDEDGA